MTAAARSPAALAAFVLERTRPAPVPLVPELELYQATEATALWHATAAELAGWDEAPYWAFPWAGGQALARHLLDHPALVRGRRVFDLATGSGVVALAAARAGAAEVVACDVDPFCEAVVALNAGRNGLAVGYRGGDPLGAPLVGFDVVLAGDVFYDRALAERGLPWLVELATSGVLALVGDPGRNYSTSVGLVERGRYEVPTSTAIERGSTLSTRVLEVRPSQARGASP